LLPKESSNHRIITYMRLDYSFMSYSHLTVASRYFMLPRTCPLMVQPLRTSPPIWN